MYARTGVAIGEIEMEPRDRAIIAAQLTAGLLASGQYKLPHDPAEAAEFAVHFYRHVRGQVVKNQGFIDPATGETAR